MADFNQPLGDQNVQPGTQPVSEQPQSMMPDAPQAPAPQQQLAPQNIGTTPQQPVQQQPVEMPIPEPEAAPVNPAPQSAQPQPERPQPQPQPNEPKTVQNAQPTRDGSEPKLDLGAMKDKVKDFTTDITSKMGKDAKLDQILMITLYVCAGILLIGPFLSNFIVSFGGVKESINIVLPPNSGIGGGIIFVALGGLLGFFVFKKIRLGQLITSGAAALFWFYWTMSFNSQLREFVSLFGKGLNISKNFMYFLLLLAAIAAFVISLVYFLKEKKKMA